MPEGSARETLVIPAGDAGSILSAVDLLREGGVIGVPTDTVYGLAARIFDEGAMEKLFAIKQRPADAPVPVLLASAADLTLLVERVPRLVWPLIRELWPGALTIVLPARSGVSRSITGVGRSVAVRVPAARSALEVLEVLGEPLTGTSANLHGEPPALTGAEVVGRLGGQIEGVLVDDAAVKTGLPSTVLEVGDDTVAVRRQGAIETDHIRHVLGARVPLTASKD